MEESGQRKLMLLFVCEVLVAIGAVASFRLMDSRFTAAITAGSLFVGLGFSGVWSLRKSRTVYWKSWGAFLIFLLVFALPMLMLRLLVPGDWTSIQVGPVSGEDFHHWSEKWYLVLMAATLWDALKARGNSSKDYVSP